MTCTRCRGLMVEDDLLDIQNPSGEVWIRARRCLNCGEIVDPRIELNRLAGSRNDRRATEYQTT